MTIKRITALQWPLAALLAGVSMTAISVAHATPRLVTQAIDDSRTVTLTGNTRPEARLTNDRGRVSDDMVLNGMQLLLKRPAETQAALDARVAELTDRTSPNYHHWMTAAEQGETYGPAAEDVAAVTGWLQSHGFTVNGVQANRMVIDFTGTAGEIRAAFGTEIHNLSVRGVPHIANMHDPRVPAALAGVVEGVVSMHNFMPHANMKIRPQYTFSANGGTYTTVVPADLAKIYNFNPLFVKKITGTGQTIVVIEDTNVFSTADWTKFRKKFELASYTGGSFTQVHPTGPGTCGNPGTLPGNEEEATLDAEWSSAGAPDAAIELASCADTETTFGGLIALQNLLSETTPPAIVSISYGECETANGAAANAAYSTTYETAAAAGVSVFVSSGDEGAASCDADQPIATHGIAVSGFASTPYNVAVGGTDFGDTYAGTTATYWDATNKVDYGSAKSYIPEIPWNDSCASVLISSKLGFSTPYGKAGYCNSSEAQQYGNITTASGSGGPSGCATGVAPASGVVGGTCKGYAKPSWQALVGVPADGVRDIPDVSLFAANGVWGHYYVFCDSDANDQASCTGLPDAWSGAGGTSFASPIMAAIQALVNQKTGERQGNPNPTLYSLANTEYGTSGSAKCNSTLGVAVGKTCIFYDTTQGDMDVNCTGKHDCYLDGGANGVLSTSTTAYDNAYGSGTGWDFATGIGSVNATNLVNGWK